MMGLVSRVRHSTNDSWRDLSGKGADRDYFLDPSSRLGSPKARIERALRGFTWERDTEYGIETLPMQPRIVETECLTAAGRSL